MEGNRLGNYGLDFSGSGMGRVMTSYYYCNELTCSVHLGEIHYCLNNWSVLNGVSYCNKTSLPVTAPKINFRMIFLYYRNNNTKRGIGT
jgi:hypothetical protein